MPEAKRQKPAWVHSVVVVRLIEVELVRDKLMM